MRPEGAERRRVLLVEDDLDLRESMIELLVEEGFDVRGAEHGEEALQLLHEGIRPDVIILDLMMPVMNGYQFREAQRNHREYAQIPVVVVSADVRASTRAASLGAAAVMAKPVDVPKLLELVRDLSVRA